jgi:hypothetical protein
LSKSSGDPYLNNVVEADHGKLKQLIRPVRGFKTLKTAYATIKGFEVMRALRKGQVAISAVRHASWSAPLVSAYLRLQKPFSSSVNASSSKRPDQPDHHPTPTTEPAGSLQQSRFSMSPLASERIDSGHLAKSIRGDSMSRRLKC